MSNHIRSNLFALNPNQTVPIQRVGLGQHQVVIVDDFYQYSEEILQVALGLPYTDRFEIVRNFPEDRARLDLDHQELVESMSALWGCPPYTFLHHNLSFFKASSRASTSSHQSGCHRHGLP
ncbi:MAG: hypothetical protein ABI618_02650 [Nitrospirota bacterium]